MARLVIEIPDLERLPGGPAASTPALARILARGRTRHHPENDSRTARHARLLGVPEPPAEAPLAHLGLATDARPAEEHAACWIRFDLLQFMPDLQSVWIQDRLETDFSDPRLKPLCDELNALFADEGLEWVGDGSAGFGLLRLDEVPDCRFLPPSEALGLRLDQALPTGRDARRWRRLINETQMLFHQFRAPGRADQQGTGLWFWGAGCDRSTPAVQTRGDSGPWRVVNRIDDPVDRGLARWLGGEFAVNEAFGNMVPVDTLVRWPLERPDPLHSLAELEQLWLAPALKALRRGRLTELQVTGSRICWRLGRLDALAFWRRRPTDLPDVQAGTRTGPVA